MSDSEFSLLDEPPFLLIIAFIILMIPLVSLDYGLIAFGMSLIAITVSGLGVLGYLYLTRHAQSEEPTDDPVNALQREFAEGEITEQEFDKRLEKLLETQERAESSSEVETSELEFN